MSSALEPSEHDLPKQALAKPGEFHSAGYITVTSNRSLLQFIAIIAILCLQCVSALAQKEVRGKITGPEGQPIPGVTITVKGSLTATQSDTAGQYSIRALPGEFLVFSYIGFETNQVAIGNDLIVNHIMNRASSNLDEVVVTGYVTEKIKNITGSVSVVKQKELTGVPAGQVEQMLQGRVAGLNVITSGEPGAPAQIYLHGIGNLGNVTPLYIIDGVEGNINSINPYDIESIQVLKDAAAYSVYGVRGANGVLVVTTKKGTGSRAKISYEFYLGRTEPLKKGLDVLNPQEQATLEWEAQKNAGFIPSDPLYGNGPKPILPDYIFAGPYTGLFAGDPRASDSLYNIDSTKGDIYQIVPFNKNGTDWYHELFKPAISQNHTLTVSGGSDKGHYLLSFGFLNQQGTYLQTYLKRFTIRVNTDFVVLNALHIGENIQLSYNTNPRVGSVDPALSTFGYLPVYDINGNSSSYGPTFQIPPTPVGNAVTTRLATKDDRSYNWQTFGNLFAELNLLKHFVLRTSFGGPLNYSYNYNFLFGSYTPPPLGALSTFNESANFNYSWTWTNTATYSNAWGDHHFRMLIGSEEKNNYARDLEATRSGYANTNPYYRLLNTGSYNPTNSDGASDAYLASLFSQLFYDYSEKYFITATLRRDGSSVFGQDKRFGWFPAVGAAWRISQEDFMMSSSWINELKLRASWGKTGFDGNTKPYNQYTTFGGGPGGAYYDIGGVSFGNITPGFRPVSIGNAKTSWQQDIVTNIGLEGNLWKGKLSFTIDWYNKNTTGLLFQTILPGILGDANPPFVNVGDINNTGIDLTLGSKGSFSKDWNWDVMLTFSHYNNKIVRLNNLPYFDDYYFNSPSPLIRNEVGYPISSFFGYKVIGYFKDEGDIAKSPVQPDAAPGRFKYQDVDGDHKITDADRIHFGNPNPKFTLGINLGISYKNFDFTTFIYGSFGNDLYNIYRMQADIYNFALFNGPKSKTALYDSWTPTNLNPKAPIQEDNLNFSNAGVVNSFALEKGSYLRDKSMMLGYSFSRSWLEKIHMERMRVYLQVLNLFTITQYSGLDPELSGTLDAAVEGRPGSSAAFGIDNIGNYPNNQKQWLIGITLGL